jgi:DNA-directed RNA polymerase subunit M/transcription elongation factor TFIIS
MFCEKCGSIGVPLDGMIMCRECGRVIEKPLIEQKHYKKDAGPNRRVPELVGSAYFNCPKCGRIKAERYEIPPQYGDEESVFLTKCSNCSYTVREEGTKSA